MTQPSDYLAIAYIMFGTARVSNSLPLADSYEALHEQLQSYYTVEFSPTYIKLAVNRLAEWGFLEIISDPYAGDLIIPDRNLFAKPLAALSEAGKSGLYHAAANGGDSWITRVFSNAEFWENLEHESHDSGERSFADIEVKSDIPASDRLVTINHNASAELEKPVSEIIDSIEAENSIEGEDGLRELVLGKLKAGRELIRACVFSIQSLHLTLIVGLNMLIEKYKDAAIGIAAAKLLDLLLKHYGIG